MSTQEELESLKARILKMEGKVVTALRLAKQEASK